MTAYWWETPEDEPDPDWLDHLEATEQETRQVEYTQMVPTPMQQPDGSMQMVEQPVETFTTWLE